MTALMGPQFSQTASASQMAASTDGTPSSTIFRRTTQGGVTYAPTVINNYPKPERASDSLAMSMRIARYAGVGGI
jgi:hypothetical protein